MMKKILSIIVICLAGFSGYSQNDLCSDAIELIPSTTCNPISGSFSGATISSAVPTCATSASQDVWYKFVATEKMNLISLTGTSNVSNGFEVYESGCGGNLIICKNANNAVGSGESIYYAGYTIGQTYYIRVFNAYTATTTGSFTICVQSFPAPANDVCANALTITPNSGCVTTAVEFSGSTLDGSASTSCSPNPSQDVWYKFNATDEMMSITISGASDISTAFELYDGSCSGTMLICRNANGQGQGEFLYYNHLVIGATYYLRIINAYSTPTVSGITVCVQNYTAPANDLCSNAIELTPDANCNYVSGTFSGANLDGTASSTCSPNSSQDVWYKFTATNTSMSIRITGITDISDAFEVYNGGCNGSLIICRNLNGNASGENITYNGFTVGNVYYIRVENAYAIPLSIASFGICLQDAALGINTSTLADIMVLPNPAQDFVRILNINAPFNYELYSSLGQLIRQGHLQDSEISVRDLQAGIYYLKITEGKNIAVRKIIRK